MPLAQENDWRTLKGDKLSALGSLWSNDDFSGRAVFTADRSTNESLGVDLIVTDVEFTISEHVQVMPHIGDTFTWLAHGKSPLTATVSATLVDTPANFGKRHLVDLYRNILRLTAVSRTGKIPALRVPGAVIEGPLVSLKIRETSKSEDAITVTLEIFVMRLSIVHDGRMVTFDYQSGHDSAK